MCSGSGTGKPPGRVEGGGEVGLTGDWSVPWSDLMMVMFVLFVVLFVYQAANRDINEAWRKDQPVEGVPAVASTPDEDESETLPRGSVYERARDLVERAELDDIEVVLGSDRSVRLSVSGPLFFDLGSADLRPATERFLWEVADVVRDTTHQIRVEGHTDTFPIHTPRFPTNWELSAIRATTVARFLIERGGVAPERLTVAGHSMYRPALPNTSSSNKARNRRVEIIITEPPGRDRNRSSG